VYKRQIETCDRQVGDLLAAVDARSQRAGEQWLVIVVTDHGHRDEGGHGGDSDAERTAWVAPVSYTHLDVYKRQAGAPASE